MKILGTDLEFTFPEAGPVMFTVTCANHPDASYLTKGTLRSLHFLGWDRLGRMGAYSHPEFGVTECPCSSRHLRVVFDEAARAEHERQQYRAMQAREGGGLQRCEAPGRSGIFCGMPVRGGGLSPRCAEHTPREAPREAPLEAPGGARPGAAREIAAIGRLLEPMGW